jgi:hypothetical protein
VSTNTERKIQDLLRQHRFRLVRQTKHLVYTEPGGRVFVCSATPSDWRAAEASLSTLKRVIANPPQPMVLAIQEYERDLAAQVIAGQLKAQGASAGMGSGKQRPSRGTGYKYVERIFTVEEIAQREQLRQQALIAKQNREHRNHERRQAKLERAAAAQKAAQERAQEFEQTCRPFLNVVEELVKEYEAFFVEDLRATIAHPTWRRDPAFNYCELPAVCYPSYLPWLAWGNAEHIHSMAQSASLERIGDIADPEESLDDLDETVEELAANCRKLLEHSDARIRRTMKFVETELEHCGGELLTLVASAVAEAHRHFDEKKWDRGYALKNLTWRINSWIEEQFQLVPQSRREKIKSASIVTAFARGSAIEFYCVDEDLFDASRKGFDAFLDVLEHDEGYRMKVDFVRKEAVEEAAETAETAFVPTFRHTGS